MRYVLVPCFVKFDVSKEVSVTFDDGEPFEIVWMADNVITNYASAPQIVALKEKVNERIAELMSRLTEDDEIYLITSGSAFHNALVSRMLVEAGVPFKFLVYERRIKKYAIVG